MILVVDHYDSFTYNLVQLIEGMGQETQVVKSDAEPASALADRVPDAVILSPGPVLTVSNTVLPGASFHHEMFDKSAGSKGAGLGLAIVTRVAQAQEIAVDYAIVDGTASVTLRFPPGPETPAA